MRTYPALSSRAKRFCLLAVIFAMYSGQIHTAAAQSNEEFNPELCDLLADPLKYAGHVISIRAQVETWRHGVNLVDQNCKPALLLEWPENPTDLQRGAEYSKFEKALKNRKQDDPTELSVLLVATFRGRFESVLEKKPNGLFVRRPQGFGHLNAAPHCLLNYLD